jgi:hypothetical protein
MHIFSCYLINFLQTRIKKNYGKLSEKE